MIDAAKWSMQWARADSLLELRALVRALVRELRPRICTVPGEVRLAALAAFGAGRGHTFHGLEDAHPLARVQEAVVLWQRGSPQAAARMLERALRRLETADDDGRP